MSLILILTNQSGLADVSDYNYEVLIGDGTDARSKSIAHGRIEGHVRSDGWKTLVQRLLTESA